MATIINTMTTLGNGGESTLFKVENNTTYNEISQAIADGKMPIMYYNGMWFQWSHTYINYHYFVSVGPSWTDYIAMDTGNGWTSITHTNLVEQRDIITSNVTATADDDIYSAKVCDQRYALKGESSVGEGGGVKVIQFNTTSQNPTSWADVKAAIDTGYPVALESAGTVYWLEQWSENATLGKNFAWFATTMNVSGNANGVKVYQCTYNIASGQTTWTTSQNSWLRSMDVEGVYYPATDGNALSTSVENLEGRVTALEQNGGGSGSSSEGTPIAQVDDIMADFETGNIRTNILYRLLNDQDGNTITVCFSVDPDNFVDKDYGTIVIDQNYGPGYDIGVFKMGLDTPPGMTLNGQPVANSHGDVDGGLFLFRKSISTVPQECVLEYNGHTQRFTVAYGSGESGSGGSSIITSSYETNIPEGAWYQSEGIWKYQTTQLGNMIGGRTLDSQKDLVIVDVVPLSKKQAYDAGWLGVVQMDWEGGVVTLGCVDQPNIGEIWISMYVQINP